MAKKIITERNAGVIYVDFAWFLKKLGLKKGHRIIDVTMFPLERLHEIVGIIIEGPSMPIVPIGGVMPTVKRKNV